MKMRGVTLCSGYNLQTKKMCDKASNCHRNHAHMTDEQPIFVVPPFIEMQNGIQECEYYFAMEIKKIEE